MSDIRLFSASSWMEADHLKQNKILYLQETLATQVNLQYEILRSTSHFPSFVRSYQTFLKLSLIKNTYIYSIRTTLFATLPLLAMFVLFTISPSFALFLLYLLCITSCKFIFHLFTIYVLIITFI